MIAEATRETARARGRGGFEVGDVPLRRVRGEGGRRWATPVALRLARALDEEATQVAREVASRIALRAGVAQARVSGPGFVEIDLADDASVSRSVVAAGTVWPGTRTRVSPSAPTEDPWSAWGAAPLDDLRGVRAELVNRVSRAIGEVLDEAGPVGSEAGPAHVAALPGAASPSGDTVGAVLARTGRDALAVHLCRHPRMSQIVLDVPALRRRTHDNPAFSLQYAHARLGRFRALPAGTGAETRLMSEVEARVGEAVSVARTALHQGEPSLLLRHLESLAAAVHAWLDAEIRRGTPFHTVGSSDAGEPDTAALTAEAARIALADGLALFGVAAPTRL